jgi:hypothetical protein
MNIMVELMEECTKACVDIYKSYSPEEAAMFLTGAKRRTYDAGKAFMDDKPRHDKPVGYKELF